MLARKHLQLLNFTPIGFECISSIVLLPVNDVAANEKDKMVLHLTTFYDAPKDKIAITLGKICCFSPIRTDFRQ